MSFTESAGLQPGLGTVRKGHVAPSPPFIWDLARVGLLQVMWGGHPGGGRNSLRKARQLEQVAVPGEQHRVFLGVWMGVE